jgi:hypothetical protein
MAGQSRIDAIKARYQAISEQQLDGVLESFRFRDQDLATRGGGLLGFSGLMMAADLVFLTLDKSKLDARLQMFWSDVALVAVLILAAGAWLAYRSLALAADYSKDNTAREFLEHWERQLLRRSAIQRTGAFLTALGTAVFLLAMIGHRLSQGGYS